jgi:hypothetical protein
MGFFSHLKKASWFLTVPGFYSFRGFRLARRLQPEKAILEMASDKSIKQEEKRNDREAVIPRSARISGYPVIFSAFSGPRLSARDPCRPWTGSLRLPSGTAGCGPYP